MSNLSDKCFSRLREHIQQVLDMLDDLSPDQAAAALAEIRKMEAIISQYDKAPDQ